MNNRLQVEQRGLEQGVDDNKVEVPGLRHLDPRIGHALRNHIGPVFAAAMQALLQLDIGKAGSLIRLRRDFITEILRSAEDID